MHLSIPTSLKALLTRNLPGHSPRSRAFAFVMLGLACFALSPIARAVSPAPDGGYDGQNTAEGTDALFDLTTGLDNTAVGFEALFIDADGSDNTATGAFALLNNLSGSNNTATGFRALASNTASGVNSPPP